MGRQENPLQILTEYDNLKRNLGEPVQEFFARFNKVYNVIPSDIKPSPGLVLLHYPYAFDVFFGLHLWERKFATLDDMHNDAIGV